MESFRVGSFIAQLRREKNLTQQELADRLGVTNKAVSKWETGEGYPEITMLPTLADALGVTADELLRGERGKRRVEVSGRNLPDNNSRPGATCSEVLLRFNNMSLVSLAIALVGLVAFFPITLATDRDGAGFGSLLALILSSIVVFLIAYNNLKAAAESGGRSAAIAKSGDRMLFVMIHVWVACLLAALTYILLRNNSIMLHEFFNFIDYITILPTVLILGGAVTFSVCSFVWFRRGMSGFAFRLPFENPDTRKIKLQLNLFSLLYGLLLAMIVYQAAANNGMTSGNAPFIYGTGLFVFRIGLFVYIILPVVYCFRRKRNTPRAIVALCAIRNVICIGIVPGWLLSSVSYGSEDLIARQMDITSTLILNAVPAALSVFIVLTGIIWLYQRRKYKANPTALPGSST